MKAVLLNIFNSNLSIQYEELLDCGNESNLKKLMYLSFRFFF